MEMKRLLIREHLLGPGLAGTTAGRRSGPAGRAACASCPCAPVCVSRGRGRQQEGRRAGTTRAPQRIHPTPRHPPRSRKQNPDSLWSFSPFKGSNLFMGGCNSACVCTGQGLAGDAQCLCCEQRFFQWGQPVLGCTEPLVPSGGTGMGSGTQR